MIVDDQTLFRQGLARLLEGVEGIRVVAQASSGEEAVELAKTIMPDIVLMDLGMPGMGGIKATRLIRAESPNTRIIILTVYNSDQLVFQGLQAGASGYVLKDADQAELARVIKAVAAGESLMDSTIARRMLAIFDRMGGDQRDLFGRLTEREKGILQLIATGKSNKEIARQLGIADKTVRNHISNIYQKLHIYDRTQVVLYAAKRGLVSLDLVPDSLPPIED